MTTPFSMDAFIKPILYYVSTAGPYLYIRGTSRSEHTLPAGVHDLQVTFVGKESCELWFTPITGGNMILGLCKIEASTTGEPRSSRPLRVHSDGTATVRLTTTPRPNAGASTSSTASLSIISQPVL